MGPTPTPFRRHAGVMSTALLMALVATASAGEEPRSGDAAHDERIDKLERLNRELLEKVEAISRDYQTMAGQNAELMRRLDELSGRASGAPAPRPASATGGGASGGPSLTERSPGRRAGGGDYVGNALQGVGARDLGHLPVKASYDYNNDGFLFETEDSEFQFRANYLLQTDARIYEPANQNPVSGGIYLSRTYLQFTGRITKPIDYCIALYRGFATIDVLNVFATVDFDKRARLRFGYFRVPYTYELYKVDFPTTLQPERSIYVQNFSGSWQLGLIGHGHLFDDRLEYAVGAFNGPRLALNDFNHTPDVAAFLNFKPFLLGDVEALRHLNVGGSVLAGNENNPLNPAVLRTNALSSPATLTQSAAVNNASVPFLAFNNNVFERGIRDLWEIHLAHYAGGLSLLAMWDSGFSSYGLGSSNNSRVRVPVESFNVQLGYILTGETIKGPTLIDPLRPFDIRPGHFGLGAFELTARYSYLHLGSQVFKAGLADPNLWTNQAQIVDLGFNWYWNKFMKRSFLWEGAMFPQPIYIRPGGFASTNNLFWIRMQLYF
jgi:phosphate-selective porin OprO/OprP